MANPTVEKLVLTYSNLTERFFDRFRDAIDGARAGDVSMTDLGGSAAEALMDGVEAVSTPWLLLLDGELKFKQAVRVYRFTVDSGKADQTRRTRLRLDAAVTLASQDLKNVADPTKKIPAAHVDAKKSTTDPKDRLIITLKSLTTVPTVPAGVYEGDIVDTANSNKPVAKVAVEWPG